MTLARDIGDGPHKPFGSALPAKVDGRIAELSRLVERPIRPRSLGPCPECGDRFFGCDCEVGDD